MSELHERAVAYLIGEGLDNAVDLVADLDAALAESERNLIAATEVIEEQVAVIGIAEDLANSLIDTQTDRTMELRAELFAMMNTADARQGDRAGRASNA